MNIAVIFAGGVGKRMHSKSLPKQFLRIHGKPIIIHTLEHFERHEEIDAIVVACAEPWMEFFHALLEEYRIKKVRRVVPGGETGQLSIFHGLEAAEKLAQEAGCTGKSIVLIHDGVRPLITGKLITDNLRSVEEFGSGITSAPANETILSVDSGGSVEEVLDRSKCRIAKAPQSFYLEDIIAAHRKALQEGKPDFIDSCSMMKYYGFSPRLIDGPVQNIKITTADDYYAMRAILEAEENDQLYGFDHSLEE